MIRTRQLPLPASPEARNLGCTCPEQEQDREGRRLIDDDCPVHGAAAAARDRAGEPGPIDTEGDIVDAATDSELRRT